MISHLVVAVAFASATPDSTPDQKVFRQILNDFNAAWNTRSADLFVKHFAEDADFMQAFGRYFPDRAKTREFMSWFFSRQTTELKTREKGVRTKQIAPGVVFLEQEIEGYGVRNADGTEQPDRRGELMLILRQRGDGWEVAAYRYLDIHGGPIHKAP